MQTATVPLTHPTSIASTPAPSPSKLGAPVQAAVVSHVDPISVPLRCRVGLHSWLPLAMSFSNARYRLGFSFCRHCPATRRSS